MCCVLHSEVCIFCLQAIPAELPSIEEEIAQIFPQRSDSPKEGKKVSSLVCPFWLEQCPFKTSQLYLSTFLLQRGGPKEHYGNWLNLEIFAYSQCSTFDGITGLDSV